MEPQAEVAVVRDADIRQRTLDALRLSGGIDKAVGRGNSVFIKPNLVDGAPFKTGEVVQPEVVEVLVKEAFKAGASEVIIGETPTVRKKTATFRAFDQLAKRVGAEFVDLSKHPFSEVEIENPVLFRKVRLSKMVFDCDVLINVPTLKTHRQCGITGAVKNMYGLLPREDRILYHRLDRVEEAIIDLYRARKPDLTVVDATYTTFHLGPRPLEDYKETFRLDLTLAGFDPVAIDTVGARILGIDPRTLRYLKWAEEKGLGTKDLAKIKVLGLPIEQAHVRKAVDAAEFVSDRMKNIRILNYGACTGCLKMLADLLRLHDGIIKEKTALVLGPDANAEKVRRDTKEEMTTILCGHCAAPTFYNGLRGIFIPGCPPAFEDLHKKLRELSTDSRRPSPHA